MKRLKKSTQKFHTEEGATLVELLAAIAILSIVVMSFLAFFVQAGNTNNRTDKVNEATLLAQAEMEYIVSLNQSDNTSLDNYQEPSKEKNGFIIKTSVNKENINKQNEPVIEMYRVITTVDEEGGNGHAQMETWLPIEEK